MTIRDKLINGDVVIGTWLNSSSAVVGEVLSQCGYDFICIDVEHSPVDITQTFNIFQAIEAGNKNCVPAVRLHGVDYAFTKRYLDAGAKVIIGPLVNTMEQAKEFVKAIKFPPLGKRGVGFCRANKYGLNLDQEFRNANNSILSVVQIEDIEAVNNIDNILEVDGIDAIFIGPYDLSASMGITGEFDHPEFINAKKKILDSCIKNNIIPGIHVVQPNPEEFLQRKDEGYRLLAYSLDITMIQRVSLDFFNKLQIS